jgi:hypothetical protein
MLQIWCEIVLHPARDKLLSARTSATWIENQVVWVGGLDGDRQTQICYVNGKTYLVT